MHTALKKYKFFKWIGGAVQRLQDSGHPEAACIRELLQKFEQPLVFFDMFAKTHDDANGQWQGAWEETKEKFAAWQENHKGKSIECALGQMLYGCHAFLFEGTFLELAGENVDFAQYFSNENGSEDAGKSDLQEHYADFMASLCSEPFSSSKKVAGSGEAPVDFVGAAGNEAEEQERNALWKQICQKRREQVCFYAPTSKVKANKFAQGGAVAAIWQSSKASTFSGKPGESHRLFLACADLCFAPAKEIVNDSAADDDIVKELPQFAPKSEFLEALAWQKKIRGDSDVLVAADGRSKEWRRKIEEWSDKELPDENRKFELWITFLEQAENSDDFRIPKRRVAFGAMNKETCVVHLPVPRIRMKTKPREAFVLCGERTTHAATYSGVRGRHLNELPRMTLTEKAAMTGQKAPAFSKDDIVEEMQKRGDFLRIVILLD